MNKGKCFFVCSYCCNQQNGFADVADDKLCAIRIHSYLVMYV